MNIKDKATLYQFDVNQVLVNVDSKYVDFPICSEVLRVLVVNGEVRIPDEFLQTSGDKRVFTAYEDGTYTSKILRINGRPMPPNYVYTPTERETFDSLVEKVNATLEDLEARVARGDFNGKDGRDGIDGKDGTNGIDGKDGADGAKGDKGDKGDRGEKGDKGDKGDAYDDSELRAELAKKQDKLIAGSGITIGEDGKTISANDVGKFELLNDITIEEEVTLLTINADYSSNPYNLKGVKILIQTPAGQASLQGNLGINGSNNNMFSWLTGMFTQNGLRVIDLHIRNGIIDISAVQTSNTYIIGGYASNVLSSPGGMLIEAESINEIKLGTVSSTVDIPLGTSIKIYGVRI